LSTILPLVNRYFADIDALETAQLDRCEQAQTQRDRMRSATLFPW
jgi:hypothetical protein